MSEKSPNELVLERITYVQNKARELVGEYEWTVPVYMAWWRDNYELLPDLPVRVRFSADTIYDAADYGVDGATVAEADAAHVDFDLDMLLGDDVAALDTWVAINVEMQTDRAKCATFAERIEQWCRKKNATAIHPVKCTVLGGKHAVLVGRYDTYRILFDGMQTRPFSLRLDSDKATILPMESLPNVVAMVYQIEQERYDRNLIADAEQRALALVTWPKAQQ